ncbi:hypothetical protein DEU35_1521 [Microbacterium sp. AG157]|nr:hypothetical protein DEU35_1521 [Microbacterium sp. AG157]
MVSASENGGGVTDVARVRLSTVPPEFRFRAASLIGIVLCGLTLGMLNLGVPILGGVTRRSIWTVTPSRWGR